VILEAHGLKLRVPDDYEARIFKRPDGTATLHLGSFALPERDADFGTRATGLMPAASAFVAVTEYLPGGSLTPGAGLFARTGIPLPLDPRRFHPDALNRPRPGRLGYQQFFTEAGRPFCLFAVVRRPAASGASKRALAPHVAGLNSALSTLSIAPRG
jgi:hypothetical protein